MASTRDLKRLTEAGLLIPSGEKRGRIYRASETLLKLRQESRLPRPLENPYDLAERRLRKEQAQSEPRLPGL